MLEPTNLAQFSPLCLCIVETMTLESDEHFTQKEIEERFERLFNRPMTAEERACFFLPAEEKKDKPSGRGRPSG
jgi:hypothetical protein